MSPRLRLFLIADFVLTVALGAGCAWLVAHDPPAQSSMTKDCTGVDEARCGTECCDTYSGFLCNPVSAHCEYQPDTPVVPMGKARDAGRD